MDVIDAILGPEELAYRDRCRAYAEKVLIGFKKKYGEINEVPDDLRKSMGEEGFFRYLIPTEYGGKGVSAVRVCLAREALAGAYGLADVVLAMQGLGSYPIVLKGSKEQKEKYLPKVASGELLTTYALTEPEAGSDVSNLQTVATPHAGGYAITGEKVFISNGYSAHMAVLFAKTPSSGDPRSVSAFLVEKGTPGFEVKKRLDLIAPHDIVRFKLDGAVVPENHLLGGIGEGFKLAMETLNLMRMSVGAAAVGMGLAAMKEAIAYASRRVQFGAPILQQQATKFKLAEMATELEAARLLVYSAAVKKDKGSPDVVPASSMAKFYATEAAFRAIDQAVQIHGGVGVMRGAEVERLYREIRPLRIYEGTSEIQKLIICRSLEKSAK